MRLFSGKIRKALIIGCAICSIFSLVVGTLYAALLVQYPPARANWLYIGFPIFLYSMFAGFFWGLTKLSKTRISKDTYYFVFIVVGVSLITMLLGNIGLKLGLSFDLIVAISIIASTPLSCLMAGYSKRTVIARLKRLGLDQGVTLFAITLLAVVPIISYQAQIFSFHETLYVLPNLAFQTTSNTTLVNGQINGSTFLADISTLQNQTFEANRFVDINVTNWGNESITFQFAISSFRGNFEYIKQLELDALSNSSRAELLFIDNEGALQCNQTTLTLKTQENLSFSVICLITGQAVSNTYPSISISISDHNTILKTISMILRAN